MKVTVIDAVIGAGKTVWMKRELTRCPSMFAEKHERFVYITPYLKEAEKAVADMTAQGAQDVEMVKDKDLESRGHQLARGPGLRGTLQPSAYHRGKYRVTEPAIK